MLFPILTVLSNTANRRLPSGLKAIDWQSVLSWGFGFGFVISCTTASVSGFQTWIPT